MLRFMTRAIGFSVFDTALGHCGIAWTATAIAGTRLPETTIEDIERRYGEAKLSTPPPFVHEAIQRIRQLLTGEADDLLSLPLDMGDVTELNRRIYAITRAIAPGRTRTYGDIARELGDPLYAQAVGQAMGRNPWPIIVPCHRVLAAGGKTGGFSAPGGVDTKFKILAIEQAKVKPEGSLFDALPLAVKPR
jgi:methylated-DNA-[protein]-cysteine S-methyltransferase